MFFSDDPDPRASREEDEQTNYGYGHETPGPLNAGGLLGWLGRSAQRSTERRARRWVYWNVPFFRSWVRYRQAGPLGRVGCVIQLLIQVALLTVTVYITLQLFGGTDLLQMLISTVQTALP